MWQSHTVNANGLDLHYLRTGGDKPVMLLLHGITDLGACWTDVAKVLEADYDQIMLDVRGHGASEVPESNDTFKPLVEDVYAVIQALDLTDPILLGHSLGAITALSLAGFYPDVPKAILLEDPPPWWMPSQDTPALRAERVNGARERIGGLKDMTREELIDMQRQESPRWSDSELENWADSKLQVSLDVTDLFGATDYHDWDWDDLMAKVSCPTLLITAEVAQGAIVTPESAETLKQQVDNAQVAHIADAGHSIHREQFDEYMAVIKKFLQNLV